MMKVMADKSSNSGLDIIRKIRDKTTGIIFGSDNEFEEQNEKDEEYINNIISKINNNIKNNVTGNNIIEYFSRINMEKENKSQKDKLKNCKDEENLVDVDKLINPDNAIVKELISSKESKAELYRDYNMIYNNIPELGQALDTFKDNIISPDDFTKKIFNIFYKKEKLDSGADKNVSNKVNNLTESYDIKDRVEEIVGDTLKYGEYYLGVLNVDKEMNKMLNEDGNDKLFRSRQQAKKELNQSKYLLTENNVALTEREKEQLNGLISINSDEEENNEKLLEEYKEEITTVLNNNIEINDSPEGLYEELLETKKEFEPELGKDMDFANYDTNKKEDEDDEKEVDYDINKSIIKKLDPERVIDITVNGSNFGYYYIEEGKALDDADQRKEDEMKDLFTNKLDIGQLKDSADSSDKKLKFLSKIFAKNIGKKIDKKYLENNKDLREIVYELVKKDYITNKKVKVTYLAPNEVVHFDIGESIYKKILFSAKLYIATLSTTMMENLIRKERRKFYVDVGMDKDVEGAVNSLIRDIKQRELSMQDLKNTDVAMKYPGRFEDYYIPRVNGDTPFDIETESAGPQRRMENDFLEYLLNNCINGIGIPAEFLNEQRSDFARSLSMKNGKFIRSIVNFQSIFGKGFTKLYRILFFNEYGNDEIYNNDENETNIKNIVSLLEVKFSSPTTLTLNNLSDQIRNVNDVVEFIKNGVIGDDRDIDPQLQQKINFELLKEFFPKLDWERYNDIVKDINKEIEKEELINNEGDEEDSGGSNW
jgi:hypothetical protein